jgi:hypothetical protein
MRALLSIGLLLVTCFAFAGEMPSGESAGVVSGVVLEVKEEGGFAYLRLRTAEGEMWAAVLSAPVKKGAAVTIENAILMKNFASKGLHKTFPSIIFGTLRGAQSDIPADSGGAGTAAGGRAFGSLMPIVPVQKLESIKSVRVPKAQGANAYTVAEINQKALTLKDKTVTVRGKVVKYNAGIMGKNWLHLQDGTGLAGSDDILVTTQDECRVGEVVTVRGVVRNDRDFGAGYAYAVLLEEGSLKR